MVTPRRPDTDKLALGPTLASGEQVKPETTDMTGVRFEQQSLIAAGGMGSILHAYDPVLERHVALKVMHPELARRPGELEAFMREARVTAQLEHPNIVPVHEALWDRSENWACFAMKLVQGQSLRQRLRELGDERLSERELPGLLAVLLKVCDAVSFAHSRNVLHLDLKPDNVMLGSHGQVYVMDWGIAVRCERDPEGRLKPIEGHMGVRGSLSYMPPEQLEQGGPELDERADVHGLGAMLYELLAGKPPFKASQHTPGLRPARAPVVDPTQVAAPLCLPHALADIAMRALAPDRAQRFATVDAFKAELESFTQGGGWFRERRFAPGEVLMHEGEQAHEAYLIVEGQCDVFQDRDGSRAHLSRMSAGDIAGETALLSGGSRTATVVAVDEVVTRVVTRATLDRELDSRGWLGVLVRRLADRFRDVDDERARLRSERSPRR